MPLKSVDQIMPRESLRFTGDSEISVRVLLGHMYGLPLLYLGNQRVIRCRAVGIYTYIILVGLSMI